MIKEKIKTKIYDACPVEVITELVALNSSEFNRFHQECRNDDGNFVPSATELRQKRGSLGILLAREWLGTVSNSKKKKYTDEFFSGERFQELLNCEEFLKYLGILEVKTVTIEHSKEKTFNHAISAEFYKRLIVSEVEHDRKSVQHSYASEASKSNFANAGSNAILFIYCKKSRIAHSHEYGIFYLAPLRNDGSIDEENGISFLNFIQ